MRRGVKNLLSVNGIRGSCNCVILGYTSCTYKRKFRQEIHNDVSCLFSGISVINDILNTFSQVKLQLHIS